MNDLNNIRFVTDEETKSQQAYFNTCATIGHMAQAGARADELTEAIPRIHAAYMAILTASSNAPKPTKQEPAVPVKKSITHDYIICLEDGKKFKSLKRHIRTHYNLTPEQYREKWSLPADYPMTAASYSEKRSQLAKDSGLGKKK